MKHVVYAIFSKEELKMKKTFKTALKIVVKAALAGAATYAGKLALQKAVDYYKKKKEVKEIKIEVPVPEVKFDGNNM